MSSGIALAPNCVSTFNDLKLGRKYGGIIYRISDDSKEIIVDSTLPAGCSFDEFTKCLPENECRYVVLDYQYKEEGAQKSKICFVAWCPDTANIKKKMMATSSKDSLRKACVGIQVEIQGTDASEVKDSCFYEKCTKI